LLKKELEEVYERNPYLQNSNIQDPFVNPFESENNDGRYNDWWEDSDNDTVISENDIPTIGNQYDISQNQETGFLAKQDDIVINGSKSEIIEYDKNWLLR